MTSATDLPWTEEKETLLRELWKQGMSGSKIAAKLGARSSGSVTGKARRLGLPKRKEGSHGKYVPTPSVDSPRSPRPKRKPIDVSWNAAIIPVEPIKREWEKLPFPGMSFEDHRADQCAWPNDGSVLDGTYRSCGDAVANLIDGKPTDNLRYCPHHFRMAYVPASGMRRKVYSRTPSTETEAA